MLKAGLGKLIEQMSKAQNDVSQVKEDLEKLHVEGEAGAGKVRVVVNGNRKVVSLKVQIEDSDVSDTELLEKQIVSALNEALSKAENEAQDRMKNVAGGLLANLPAGLNLPGMG